METFKTVIYKSGNYVIADLPFNAKGVFKQEKGRIYVRGYIDDIRFRSKLIPKDDTHQMLTIDESLQKALSFENDKEVTIQIEKEDLNNQADIVNISPMDTKMDVLEAITTRKSIRKYTNQEVSEELINQLLNAASCAPSGHNFQPWQFVVIRDKKIRKEIESIGTYTKMIGGANVCILVCGDENLSSKKELLYADLGATSQTILLSAHALGLGAVWCAANLDTSLMEYLKNTLKLDVKVIPFSIIAIGYPNEKREATPRLNKKRVHKEIFGNND